MKWFSKRATSLAREEPDLFAEQDQTGRALGMDYLVTAMGENKAVPRSGDAIIQISSCSMGTSVRSDERFRVIGEGRQNGASICVPCKNARDGSVESLSVFYMRQHTKLDRTWWLLQG